MEGIGLVSLVLFSHLELGSGSIELVALDIHLLTYMSRDFLRILDCLRFVVLQLSMTFPNCIGAYLGARSG